MSNLRLMFSSIVVAKIILQEDKVQASAANESAIRLRTIQDINRLPKGARRDNHSIDGSNCVGKSFWKDEKYDFSSNKQLFKIRPLEIAQIAISYSIQIDYVSIYPRLRETKN